MYLRLFLDFREAGHYSWGSAYLTYMYIEICRATTPAARAMGVCVLLLQSWVRYRMSFITPW